MFSGTSSRQQKYSAAPAATDYNYDPSLEPYHHARLGYPESSQRTSPPDFDPSNQGQNGFHLPGNAHPMFSADDYSPMPVPSDRPPPAPASHTHSFPEHFARPMHAHDQPSSSYPPYTRPQAHSFHDPSFLPPSASDYAPPYREPSPDGDDERYQAPYSHHRSNFIPIVPIESSSSSAYGGAYNASEAGSPQSSTSLSPPPADTLPSPEGIPPRKAAPPKMHVCEVCCKEFPRPSGLRTHMNMHNHVRPYPCAFPGCPKRFSVRSNARRHYRIHSDGDPPTGPPPGPPPPLLWQAPAAPAPAPTPPQQQGRAAFKVRWAPPKPNLYSRTLLGDTGGSATSAHDASAAQAQSQDAAPAVPALHPYDLNDNDYYDPPLPWAAGARQPPDG
ncbi:hypothetical protein B0H15DRAFT_505266 [Mycena belliarum]|uniref:C2H2-type domain-containing protein n=1 Tax=Mycena belliarum TaxID=1033014 RepID=A0AAD6XW01_9AGAR|nr:hypothetical protein B0H15DRAFT_505266 [Mycena belliae]